MIQFTARRMSSSGTGHEHIDQLKWVNPASQEIGTSDVRPTLVTWVRANPGQSFVQDSSSGVKAYVGVVEGPPPYLRTYADGVWTNNLLSLPTF